MAGVKHYARIFWRGFRLEFEGFWIVFGVLLAFTFAYRLSVWFS